MWKIAFVAAALAVSMSPADARKTPTQRERVEKREPSELKRDVERISREIYPERSDWSPPRGSFAAGSAPKKR